MLLDLVISPSDIFFKKQLTIYDAAYLNVAMTLNADHFFTFDAALKKAAGVEGWQG